MSGRLQPWSLYIDVRAVLAVFAALLLLGLVAALYLRARRAKEKPQDRD